MKKINNDLNIFVSCHKNCYVPDNKYLIPIQVGAVASGKKLNILKDDTGDNISELNSYFCELTAQYWAWKNVDCEFYGFFHYRRYLSFNDSIKDYSGWNEFKLANLTEQNLERIGINKDYNQIKNLINDYDIIIPEETDLSMLANSENTVYKHYKNSKDHNIIDLDKAAEIINKLYPKFAPYVKACFNSKKACFCNMYIMKKNYFFEYCEWLFPILFKLHAWKNYAKTTEQESRMIGFVAERLFNIWLLYKRETDPKIKIKRTTKVLFDDYNSPYPNPVYSNKTAICFASDENYAKFLGVALTSIVKNSKKQNKYDIVVLDNSLSYNSRQLLMMSVAGSKNFSLRFIKVESFLANKQLYERDHINKTTYIRFEILNIFRNYEKVIWLDCDLVVDTDIAKLYDVDLKNNYVAACRDSVQNVWNNAVNEFGDDYRKYNSKILKVKNVFNYFNAGVMIYNIGAITKKVTADKLFEMATSFNYRWQDQDILNKVCYRHVKFLNLKWNFMPHKNVDSEKLIEAQGTAEMFKQYCIARQNPYIIHFAGHQQPIYEKEVDKGWLFWKYARGSYFYENILSEISKTTVVKTIENYPVRIKTPFKRKVKNFLKKLFPYNTRRGRFARKIYRRIKGSK